MIDIRFDGVSKRYRIRRPASPGDAPVAGDFWAIHDVTFEVPHGETLGIRRSNDIARRSTRFGTCIVAPVVQRRDSASRS